MLDILTCSWNWASIVACHVSHCKQQPVLELEASGRGGVNVSLAAKLNFSVSDVRLVTKR
jgi:hypothetical protein